MDRIPRLALLIAAMSILVPAAALAGKKSVVGDQTLQIKARLKPGKAKARNATLHLEVKNGSTTPGAQPVENGYQAFLVLPKGTKLNPKAIPACKRSALDKSKSDPSVCPSRSRVGSGSVVINARPLISQLINGTAVIYNAVNDTGEGQPVGTRNLVLFVNTSIGVKATDAFRIEKTANGRVKLVTTFTKPSKPGYSPGNYTIQDAKLTVHARSKKSFLTNPKRCTKKGWVFRFTITSYFGQKTITATHRQRCKK